MKQLARRHPALAQLPALVSRSVGLLARRLIDALWPVAVRRDVERSAYRLARPDRYDRECELDAYRRRHRRRRLSCSPHDDRMWLTGATWSKAKRSWVRTGSPRTPYYAGFLECLEGAFIKKPGSDRVDFISTGKSPSRHGRQCFRKSEEPDPYALGAARDTGVQVKGWSRGAAGRRHTGACVL
jgi:hypothetical protein